MHGLRRMLLDLQRTSEQESLTENLPTLSTKDQRALSSAHQRRPSRYRNSQLIPLQAAALALQNNKAKKRSLILCVA